MMLTTKGRYAVMAMVDVAYYGKKNKAIPLHEISSRQEIALNYLEQLFNKLKKHNLVESVKGPGGGYILKKLPEEISMFEIMSAVGETLEMTRCKNQSGCLNNGKKVCFTHSVLHGLERKIEDYLRSISLYDICNNIK